MVFFTTVRLQNLCNKYNMIVCFMVPLAHLELATSKAGVIEL